MSVLHRPTAMAVISGGQLLACLPAGLQAATWTGANNNWNLPTAWSPTTPPNAPGAVADFSTKNYTANNTANLNGPRTIGSLLLGDTAAPIFTTSLKNGTGSSSLTFHNNGAGATIGTLVSSDPPPTGFNRPPDAANVIEVPVVLADNLAISVNTGSANASLTPWPGVHFLQALTETGGPRGVTIGGNGRGITGFRLENTFSGGLLIQTGSAQAEATGNLGTGPVTVQATGQAAWYSDHTTPNDFTIAGTGYPEPQGDRGALSFRLGTHRLTGSIHVTASARIEGQQGTTVHLEGPLTGSANLEINALSGGTELAERNGTFFLEGNASAYTGRIAVSRGHLELGSASAPGGNLTVAQTASLGGESTIAGNLTLGTSAPPGSQAVLRVDPASPGALQVGGNVTISTTTVVSLVEAPTSASFKVLGYGGTLTGATNLEIEGGLASYRAGSGFNTATSGEIRFDLVTGSLTWNGGTGIWNTTDPNWADGELFHPLDDVTFGDTGAGQVTLTGVLQTGTVHIANAAGSPYTFHAPSGSSIASGNLVKDGEGDLVIGLDAATTDNLHRYAGGTVIHAGHVRLLAGATASLTSGPLGIGPITMTGGTLSAAHPSLPRQIFNPLALDGDVTLGDASQSISFNIASAVTLGADIVLQVDSPVTLGKGNTPTTGVSDGGAGHGLTKTGPGLLAFALGTTNSLGGPLAVNGGTLQAGSSLSTPALTVASGATLAGSGPVSAAVTIAAGATLSPGMVDSSTKTSAFPVTGDLALGGTFLCGIDPAGTDRLTVSGALDLTTATLDLDISPQVTLEGAYLIASYGSLVGSSFANVVDLPAGYQLDYSYDNGSSSNHIALVPAPTTFETWAAAMNLTAGNDGPDDDPNHDGAPNLVHFALATDPLGNGSHGGTQRLETVEDGEENRRLTLTFPVRVGATFTGQPPAATVDGIVYRILASDDLENPGELAVEEVTPARSEGMPEPGDHDGQTGADWEYRTFRLADPLPTHTRAFLSIAVETAP